MKHHFGNVLVSSQEYAIYTWTSKEPGCIETNEIGNYPENTRHLEQTQISDKAELKKLTNSFWSNENSVNA